MNKNKFGIGDKVRFNKAVNSDVWATFGKRGRQFVVVDVQKSDKTNEPHTYFYALLNVKTGSRIQWFGESLIKRVSE